MITVTHFFTITKQDTPLWMLTRKAIREALDRAAEKETRA